MLRSMMFVLFVLFVSSFAEAQDGGMPRTERPARADQRSERSNHDERYYYNPGTRNRASDREETREGGRRYRADHYYEPRDRSMPREDRGEDITERDVPRVFEGMVIAWQGTVTGVDREFAQRELAHYVKARGGRLVFAAMPGVTHVLHGTGKVTLARREERRGGTNALSAIATPVIGALTRPLQGRDGGIINRLFPSRSRTRVDVQSRDRKQENDAFLSFFVHPVGASRETRAFTHVIDGEGWSSMVTETDQRIFFGAGGLFTGVSGDFGQRSMTYQDRAQRKAWLACLDNAVLEKVRDIYRRSERGSHEIGSWRDVREFQEFEVIVSRQVADRLTRDDVVAIRQLQDGRSSRRAIGEARIVDISDDEIESTLTLAYRPRDEADRLEQGGKYIVELPASD